MRLQPYLIHRIRLDSHLSSRQFINLFLQLLHGLLQILCLYVQAWHISVRIFDYLLYVENKIFLRVKSCVNWLLNLANSVLQVLNLNFISQP